MEAKNEKVFVTMTSHFKLGQNDVLVILRQFFIIIKPFVINFFRDAKLMLVSSNFRSECSCTSASGQKQLRRKSVVADVIVR